MVYSKMGRKCVTGGKGMTIYYRVSPYLSRNKNPLGDNKLHIIQTCFESFKNALGNQKVYILSDNLSEKQLKIFEGFNIIQANSGNIGSFQHQLELASQLDPEEKVFLIEDDYLWVPGAIDLVERSLDVLPIVSPYDHPGHYIEDRFKHQERKIVLIDNHTYRSAPSNTLTFATKAGLIKKYLDHFKSYGVRDHEMFSDLDVEMFVPVPSLATHLVVGLLAPNIDWNI